MNIVIAADLDRDLVAELQATHPQAKLIFTSSDELPQHLAEVEILFTRRLNATHVLQAPKLKMVQIPFAGMDAMPLKELKAQGALLANARIHGETIGELTMGMMISLARSFAEIQRNQIAHKWIRIEQHLLKGSTVALIGVGTLGGEIAKHAKAFGMKTIGFTRSGRDNEFLDESYRSGELLQHIGKADYVVVACPLTAETLKMVDATVFKAMKKTAYLINVGRGPVVDEAALIEALQQEEIAGAALDVFEVEPLPEDSPLWDMPNVICFPHLAGNLEGNERRAGQIFVENVGNFLAKRPLRCAVDLDLGF